MKNRKILLLTNLYEFLHYQAKLVVENIKNLMKSIIAMSLVEEAVALKFIRIKET